MALLLGGFAACKATDDPREAFVGTFGFTSGSFQTDCSPVPEDHQEIDDTIEIEIAANANLEIHMDDVTVPCADEDDIASEPKRVGCTRTKSGVTYEIQLRIDHSYDYPNRMHVAKTFTEPSPCSITFSGNLTPL